MKQDQHEKLNLHSRTSAAELFLTPSTFISSAAGDGRVPETLPVWCFRLKDVLKTN